MYAYTKASVQTYKCTNQCLYTINRITYSVIEPLRTVTAKSVHLYIWAFGHLDINIFNIL